MKRIIFSIVLGLIFPFACFMAIGFASDYIKPTILTEITFYGESAPGIIFIPFAIPSYADIFLGKNHIAPQLFDTFWFRFISFILFDWGLYGIIFYFVLGRLKRLARPKTLFSKEPPPSPDFG